MGRQNPAFPVSRSAVRGRFSRVSGMPRPARHTQPSERLVQNCKEEPSEIVNECLDVPGRKCLDNSIEDRNNLWHVRMKLSLFVTGTQHVKPKLRVLCSSTALARRSRRMEWV